MSRTSSDFYKEGKLFNGYDYIHQAWVINGVYVTCGHPEAGERYTDPFDGMLHIFAGCHCYGRVHAGKTPQPGMLDGSLVTA